MTPDPIDESINYSTTITETNDISATIPSDVRKRINITRSETKEVEKEENVPLLLRKDIKWKNVIAITSIHIIAIYGFINFPYTSKIKLFLWTSLFAYSTGFGVTAGAHRYWTHRSYKVNLPLKIFLVFAFLGAGQNSLGQWVRDHRTHHKYSETNADPHNINRGFFFAHCGWLMMKKHPDVIKNGKKIDMSDVLDDPIAAFAEKYYLILGSMMTFIVPILVPIIFWDEDFVWSFIACISRYVYVLNSTWCVNSLAHLTGTKPYNKDIAPTENAFVGYVSMGEGWHNYHHVFPFDYRTSEIGGGRCNLTAYFIDLFAKIGWAYDLKEPSESLVHATIAKRGDGTHQLAAELLKDVKLTENVTNSIIDTYVKSY